MTRDRTYTPCIGSTDSSPPDCKGGPYAREDSPTALSKHKPADTLILGSRTHILNFWFPKCEIINF